MSAGYKVKKTWIYGWIQLPCFKVRTLKDDGWLQDGGAELICNRFLSLIWELFFAPFWDGTIHVDEEVEE